MEYKHEGLSLYNKEGYNQLKEDYNYDKDVNKLIVLLIYGFNHYLRFNANGVFNVPVGKVDLSQSIYNNLQTFVTEIKHKHLQFSVQDFRSQELYAEQDAFYYFDPPYLITTAPYNTQWNIEEERALFAILDHLNSEGKQFALSNVVLSNGKENTLLKEWARQYNVHFLKRQYRNANYQKKNITDTIEVLITNNGNSRQ